ncbi:hypothetical protein EIP91_005333 [Steccherinum ochraceum]|uniref:F-box domain-containing protein n=1 Tax=Steccherinum ochraceum TaxID=92696 RepID=A0A4R0R7A8_9APHY|nr:hypothetical protein EIP91_005333 [Steccherinum ochraceum]
MHDSPRVPGDIISEITEHLGGDMATLSVCSVVSQSWTHEARKHLFREIALQSEKGDNDFQEFAVFVKEHPEASCFVKQLKLSGRPHRAGDEHRPHVAPQLISSILEHLPNVKELSFYGVLFTFPIRSPPPPLSSPFALEHLTCFNVSATAQVWFRMMQLFSAAELKIHLDPVSDSRRGLKDAGISAPIIAAPSLKLAGVPPMSIEKVLEPALVSNCLQRLDIAISQPGHPTAIGRLINKSSGTMGEFRLDISGLRYALGPAAWQALNLTSCAALSSFSISINLGVHTPVQFSTLLAILSHCPPTLRHIACFITLHRATPGTMADPVISRNVTGDDCAQLEALLVSKYRKLEKLLFDLRDVMDPYVLPEQIWNTIRESMPRLRDKGVLTLHPRLRNSQGEEKAPSL